jgi:predicted TIM-barrel fold metal-dependent hydrolase
MILAHFGHHAFDEAVTMLATHPNLVADLTPVIGSPVPITAAIADRHAHKILFGSDAPNTGHSAGDLIGRFRATGPSNETLGAVLSDNARKLIA